MTKKDYVLLAVALANTKPVLYPSEWSNQWEQCVVAISDALERENPQFDCARFYEACGYTK